MRWRAFLAPAVVAVALQAPPPAAARTASVVDPGLPPAGMHVLREQITLSDATKGRTGLPPLTARAGILIDIDQRTVLWQQDAHRALPVASTTKVMTALVVLENFAMDRQLTVPAVAAQEQSDETVMGLVPGQQFAVQDLLEGMLLESGNDAANTLAVATVGIDRFVAAMNAQERALGLSDSSFVSPVGLDNPDHHASAYDLAVITLADVEHYPFFGGIVTSRQLDIPATATHPDYPLYNLNQLLWLYPRAVGVKPGITGDSGPCLVSMAVRDGHRLIAVLLDADRPAVTSRALLDWGFQQEGEPTDYPTPSPKASPSPH